MARSRQTRRAGPTQQTRSAHTVPQRQAPPQQQHRPQQHQMAPTTQHTPAVAQPSQGPGLFGQMASTAAGVAVGSTIGHTMANGISSLFGGGRSEQPAQQAEAPPQQYPSDQYQQPAYQQQQPAANACEADAKAFMKCLESNSNDISACQWYLDNLKACQAAASQY
ncbi:uncharacterized protein BYT42DRAFT_598811 [Radiomyces spectabilis]|uniref:uncharacterized protein n=1 Tax=Radiomyces spectabilis TaxID=64574 RepID=UPI00221F733B|nr:uncharacterized protein BYT42DRAFT_598811 [Radiomyces spectabilis]KAI8377755.1 hypothetical protein BYT42DRAFT_598811 [Radiomyces spectabilis]